jgi:ABC-type sugar transport system permease subunit
MRKEIPRRHGGLGGNWQDKVFPYLMCFPAILLFCMFILYPFFQGFVSSFHKWDGLSAMKWIGLRNYQNIFKDALFWNAMKNTFLYAILVTVFKNIFGVMLALFLVRKFLPGRTLFRTAVFLPVTLSYVVIGVLWMWIFNPTFGLLNPLMNTVGMGGFIRGWLSDPQVAIYSVIWVDIWKWTGFHMVLYIAGLQGISEDYYEAAAIDGATGWLCFWKITVPQLNSTIFINFLMSITGAFTSNYALVNVMTGGGPSNSTEVAATYIVKTGLKYVNLGKANAMTFVLFCFVLVFGLIQLKTISKDDNYGN